MDWVKYDPVTRSKYSTELLWYVRLPLVLNTYQGVIKVHEFQGARINGITSFRTEHRKPFRKVCRIILQILKIFFNFHINNSYHNYYEIICL